MSIRRSSIGPQQGGQGQAPSRLEGVLRAGQQQARLFAPPQQPNAQVRALENKEAQLSAEVKDLKAQVAQREAQIKELSSDRAQIKYRLEADTWMWQAETDKLRRQLHDCIAKGEAMAKAGMELISEDPVEAEMRALREQIRRDEQELQKINAALARIPPSTRAAVEAAAAARREE